MKRMWIGLFAAGMLGVTVLGSSVIAENATEAVTENVVDDGALSGGWELPEDIELTEEAKKAFEEATRELTGVSYEAVALLGKQIVAGTNYSILCRATVVAPEAVTNYAIVYVYEDLDGNAEILRIQDLVMDAQGEE